MWQIRSVECISRDKPLKQNSPLVFVGKKCFNSYGSYWSPQAHPVSIINALIPPPHAQQPDPDQGMGKVSQTHSGQQMKECEHKAQRNMAGTTVSIKAHKLLKQQLPTKDR